MKNEAVEPPTIAIMMRFCGLVVINCLQKRCTI
jgi:hypothetical protein